MVGEKIWNKNNDSHYLYEKVTEGLKSYIVGEEVTSDKFGTEGKKIKAPIIKAEEGSIGKDRFYIMALEDIDEERHYWYYNATDLDNIQSSSDINFGTEEPRGKTDTRNMIEKWNKRNKRKRWLWGAKCK